MEDSDFDVCAEEPITTPGLIQPHGAMLVVDDDFTVLQASGNVADFLSLTPAQLLGKPLTQALPSTTPRIRTALAESLASGVPSVTLPVIESLRGDQLLSARVGSGSVIVEIEALTPDATAADTHQTSWFAERVRKAGTAALGAKRLAEAVKTLTGSDRVMIYRFDSEWNGQVVGEAVSAGHPLFLGLFFPSTDIPPQARELYTQKLLRYVPNVDYTPVKMHGLEEGVDVDMSLADLRSMSPRHLQYMRNMGVTASLSASIVAGGKLWGLILCQQHAGVFKVSPAMRAEVLTLAEVAAEVLPAKEDDDVVTERDASLRILTAISAALGAGGTSVDAIRQHAAAFAQMVKATGLAIRVNGEVLTSGRTPPAEWFDDFAALARKSADGFATQHLAGENDRYEEIAGVASGVLALPLGSDGKSWIIWFREEEPVVRKWGGDPGAKQSVQGLDGSFIIEPRRSFEEWSELLRNHSAPWRRHEVALARRLASLLAA